MKRSIAWVTTVGLLACAHFAQAQEAVTIKIKDRGEGDVVRVTKIEETTVKVKVVDGNGTALVDKSDKTGEKAEFKETVLKRDSNKPASKFEREYAKAQTTKDGDTTDTGLQGKTVLIEKKGSKYAFAYKDGAEVVGDAATFLMKEFARKTEDSVELDKMVLPKGAVKPGEAWKLDMQAILKEVFKKGEAVAIVDKATGTGTLLKTYKKNGKEFGVMQFKMSVPLKSAGKGAQQLVFAEGGKVTIDVNMDVCIDGSAEAGTMKMKMNMSGNAMLPQLPGGTLSLNVDTVGTETIMEAAKK